VLYLAQSGSNAHDLLFGLEVAKVFTPAINAPYLGLQAGMRQTDLFGDGSQRYLGAMFGVRHVVGGTHGAVKLGLDYRRFFENADDGFDGYNDVGIGMGFDLWF
jgi:hypothetical protein